MWASTLMNYTSYKQLSSTRCELQLFRRLMKIDDDAVCYTEQWLCVDQKYLGTLVAVMFQYLQTKLYTHCIKVSVILN